ncbi:MAG: sulfite exporter TauE/SafE family protein [Clostridia bacterium]
MNIVYLILIGMVSGVISAMGMGGGTVLILVLGFASELDQVAIQGINLLYFLPIAVFSIICHIKNKNIEIKTASSVIPFGLIGAIIGATIANFLLNGMYLKKIFGVFVLLVGLYTLLSDINWSFLKNPNSPAK